MQKPALLENIRGFSFTPKVLPPGVTRLWIEPQAGAPTLRAEADTQDYVRTEIIKRGPPTSEGLYVPKVFDYADFEIEGIIYSCIVMEFVTGTPISSIMKPTLWSRDISESANNEIVRPFKRQSRTCVVFPPLSRAAARHRPSPCQWRPIQELRVRSGQLPWTMRLRYPGAALGVDQSR